MVSRPPSQRPKQSSAVRSRPAQLLAFIAVRCAAPMASVPISAITPLLVVQLSQRPLPEPATAVGAGIVLSSRAQVGAGAVGAAATAVSIPTLAQPPVWAAMVLVWALP